ncbi:hypothetical protein F4821DRAFT_265713 [Hypoxylon rubiginosum]|uniref:Uncharacterized protein n=1 Tax=Hypoxylon rubiginosum TaxID=110542 RepID=A0ACC0CJQ3_9PEZI|nr:hypothetical protein F4821DRAFT_265713 [Hypoxylon rubiginosum]
MALITLAVLSAIPAALAGTEFVASTTDERGRQELLHIMGQMRRQDKLFMTTYWNSAPNKESCEGHDTGSGNGGDVCCSDRATGCI